MGVTPASASGCGNMPQGETVFSAVDWRKQQDPSLFLMGPGLAFAFHQDRNQGSESTMSPIPREDVGKRANAPRCEPPDWDRLGFLVFNSAGQRACFGMGENPGDFPGPRPLGPFSVSHNFPIANARAASRGIGNTTSCPCQEAHPANTPARWHSQARTGRGLHAILGWCLASDQHRAGDGVIGANLVEQPGVCCPSFCSKTFEY